MRGLAHEVGWWALCSRRTVAWSYDAYLIELKFPKRARSPHLGRYHCLGPLAGKSASRKWVKTVVFCPQFTCAALSYRAAPEYLFAASSTALAGSRFCLGALFRACPSTRTTSPGTSASTARRMRHLRVRLNPCPPEGGLYSCPLPVADVAATFRLACGQVGPFSYY